MSVSVSSSVGGQAMIRVVRGGRRGRSALLHATVLAIGIWGPAEASEARLFDRPAKVRTIKPGAEADPLPEIICTTYSDLMVRESGTDTPDPDPPVLVPRVDHAGPPICDRRVPATAVPLPMRGFSLLGRKGDYLFFQASDPNGAVAFMILDAHTGRTLFEDKTEDGAFRSIVLRARTLQLSFVRGINGACSIPQGAAACWAKMADAGQIPAEIAKMPPPVQACAESYRKSKTPADDPSLISYAVAVTLDAANPARIRAQGPIGCEPAP